MTNAAKNSELVIASGTDRRRWPTRADRIISVARMISKRMTEVILYSFRRCPYAMRARMALSVSGASYEHREVVLRDKPPEMLEVSPKGTVPVLVVPGAPPLEESLDIMHWALGQNDPEGWLDRNDQLLIETNDGPFKHHLDRYKYATRYDDVDPEEHRAAAFDILKQLDERPVVIRLICAPAALVLSTG